METSRQVFRYNSTDLARDQKVLEAYGPTGSTQGTAAEPPVIFCDLSDVIFKWNFWQILLPRVHPYYAVKCNYDPMLLATLARLGAGFDCASKAEIEMVQKLNVSPQMIVYAQPVKFVPHINFARENGVDLMVFDRRSELDKIKEFFPAARLLLRFRYDAKEVLFKMGDKFGCDPLLEGPDLLRAAKALNLNVVGTSFHVGTGCNDIVSYRNALEFCRKLSDIGTELGYEMSVVDIGGGFHGTRDNNFRDIAAVINKALEDFFPDPNVQVIAEPGQFFTTSAFTLFATVQASRFVPHLNCMEYVINDGHYNTFRSCPEILQFLEIEAVGRKTQENHIRSIIIGQCPEERDLITDATMLPSLGVGDTIVFRNMGSYSLSMQSKYGRFDHPVVKYFVKEMDAVRISLAQELKNI